jgi:type I restriction enzyme, S subunit
MWDDEGLPWVSIADMSKGPTVTRTDRRVSQAGVIAKNLPIGNQGTLLFAMYASVGAVSTLGTQGSWNQAILGIHPRIGLADSRFARYWLEHLKPNLSALFRSNTQDNLNAEQVGNLPFPVLAVSRQSAIADFLDRETARIDALIAAKRRIVGLMEEHFEARLMTLLFGGSASRMLPLRRMVDCLAGYAFPSAEFVESQKDSVRLLRGANVAPGDMRWEDVVCWPLAKVDGRIEKYLLRAGDIVVGMDRPLIKGGMRVAAVRPSDLPALLVQRVARLRANSLASSAYLRYLLTSKTFESYFSPITTGVSVPHISEDQILSFPVPAKPRSSQDEVVAVLEEEEFQVAEMQALTQRQITLLQEHRRALITAGVTGQCDIPEPI